MLVSSPPLAQTDAVDRRLNAGQRRVGYLDGWRGLAILLVLQAHFLPLAAIDTGQFGVVIFFSLSGLLMSDILFVKRMPLATFYKRRVSRILPAFVVFVGLLYGIAAWAGDRHAWSEIVSTLAFMRTYVPAHPDIWHSGLPIGHLWSLNVEEHCYVFLSLLTLLAVMRGREAWALGAAAAATMVVYYAYMTSPAMSGTSFEIRTETAASCLLASAAYFLVRDRVALHVKPWMPIAAVAIASLGYLRGSYWWLGAIVSPLALAFAVNHLQHTPPWLRAALASRSLRQMGIWSYSIYLWQQPFFVYKSALPPATAVFGALGAGLASFYLLEKPSRAWINQRW